MECYECPCEMASHSVFSRVHECDRQTDRWTLDTSVAVGGIADVMPRNKNSGMSIYRAAECGSNIYHIMSVMFKLLSVVCQAKCLLV